MLLVSQTSGFSFEREPKKRKRLDHRSRFQMRHTHYNACIRNRFGGWLKIVEMMKWEKAHRRDELMVALVFFSLLEYFVELRPFTFGPSSAISCADRPTIRALACGRHSTICDRWTKICGRWTKICGRWTKICDRWTKICSATCGCWRTIYDLKVSIRPTK